MCDKSEARSASPMEIIRQCVLLVLTGVFLFSGFKVANIYFTGKNEEEAFAALTELVESYKTGAQENPPVPIDPADDIAEDPEAVQTEPSVLSYYRVVFEKNPDFTGWLTVPNTNINYPVMYTPDEPEHYLRTAFDGTYSLSGTPFIGAGCDTDSNCFIIYGHNMKNDTMFGTLDKYSKAEFCEQNPEFTFDTLYEERTYRVFAAFKGKILGEGKPGFRYYDYAGDLDEETFSFFVAEIQSASLYQTDHMPAYGDQILLLSTCSYHTDNGRFVVAAYRSASH